jgi:hypothetical protein
MSLRLEDINTKESSMRLSMQAIDYRLVRLEEIASTTNETLTLLRTMLARQTPPPTCAVHQTSGVNVSGIPSFSVDDMSDDGREPREPSPAPSAKYWRADSLAASIVADEVLCYSLSLLLLISKSM